MVFFQENFPRKKDGVYVINLNDKQIRGTRLVSLFIDRNMAVYFDSFGTEDLPQGVLHKIKDK